MAAAGTSSSSSSSSAAAASFSRAPRFSEQPRHFHAPPLPQRKGPRGEGDDDDQDASGPADAAVSRVRLYRHALESVFAFLRFKELAVVLSVNREWQAAVGSMRSIQHTLVSSGSIDLMHLMLSRLRRHVTCLTVDYGYRLMLEHVLLLHMSMPHLLRLDAYRVSLPSGSPSPRWPPSLQQLILRKVEADSRETNHLLHSLRQLSQLRELTLGLKHEATLSFAPIAALPLLQSLSIDWIGDSVAPLNDVQVAEMRALEHIERFNMIMDSTMVTRLLQVPHHVCWRNLPRLSFIDDAAGELLPSLGRLSTLAMTDIRCTYFDWLPRMQSLTDLTLGLLDVHPSADAATQSLMVALPHCASLTSLVLFADQMTVTPEQLATCLPAMPALTAINIWDACLPSLSFLAAPSLAQSLQELSLNYLRQPMPALVELRHLHGLRALRRLTLNDALAAPVDAYVRSLFEPPSVLLPQLEDFACTRHYDAEAGQGDEA